MPSRTGGRENPPLQNDRNLSAKKASPYKGEPLDRLYFRKNKKPPISGVLSLFTPLLLDSLQG